MDGRNEMSSEFKLNYKRNRLESQTRRSNPLILCRCMHNGKNIAFDKAEREFILKISKNRSENEFYPYFFSEFFQYFSSYSAIRTKRNSTKLQIMTSFYIHTFSYNVVTANCTQRARNLLYDSGLLNLKFYLLPC